MNPQPEGLRSLLKNPRSQFSTLWLLTDNVDGLPTIARTLARMGWDESNVSAALQHHGTAPAPDQADALAAAAVRATAEAKAADLTSELRVVSVYLSTPPQVDVAIGDKQVRISMREFGNRVMLRQACLDHFLRAPAIPGAKNYDEWMNASIDAAEKIEAPPDASDVEHERYGIAQTLLTLHLGAGYRSTEGQHVYVDREAGFAYIHFPAIMAGKIKLMMPSMTARRASEILREIGWEPAKVRDGETTHRLWRGPAAPYLSREADWSLIEELDDMRRKHWSERNAARESAQAVLGRTDDDKGGWGAP